jgi:hypothetical protein
MRPAVIKNYLDVPVEYSYSLHNTEKSGIIDGVIKPNDYLEIVDVQVGDEIILWTKTHSKLMTFIYQLNPKYFITTEQKRPDDMQANQGYYPIVLEKRRSEEIKKPRESKQSFSSDNDSPKVLMYIGAVILVLVIIFAIILGYVINNRISGGMPVQGTYTVELPRETIQGDYI